LDDVGAESGSAAIDLTTGISWVFGWLKWMFLLDWGKKIQKTIAEQFDDSILAI
jgi:hypothetical protein